MLLECLTHRRRGHYEGDAERYRDPVQEREWSRQDPVARLRERAIAERWLDEGEAERVAQEASEAVERAVEFARSSPFPDAALAGELVYGRA
jgi:pyruvate dehydrogenase E1 component alpha subunit